MNYDMALDKRADLIARWKTRGSAEPRWHQYESSSPSYETYGHAPLEARLTVAVAVSNLEGAPAFFWASAIGRVIEDAATGLPNTYRFDPDQWPSPSGFFCFETPGVVSTCRDCGHQHFLHALSWGPVPADFARYVDASKVEGRLADMKVVVSWTCTSKDPVVAPNHMLAMSMGSQIDGVLEAIQCDRLSLIDTPATWEKFKNFDPASSWFQYHSGDLKAERDHAGDPMSGERMLRRLGTMLAFITQRVLVQSAHRARRATRRRLSPTLGPDPTVQVVKLRRPAYPTRAAGDSAEVDWSCQWMVDGHWRDQWYPSKGYHAPIWIAPYIKGPEDKPLKDAERLFAVVR